MSKFVSGLKEYFDWFYVPDIRLSDILEIIILSFVIYYVMLWFKRTRAWTLFKGILILAIVFAIASFFNMNTILWIYRNMISVSILALFILFQPELRRGLEELGRKNILSEVLTRDDSGDKSNRITENTIRELVAASIDMSKAKTGALIVIEQNVALGEYESTGIQVDAHVTKQLLINIFEKNTPLHDGAVIIRNNRVIAATCYLPLTGRHDLNKDLGTRHRAAVGISEVSDSVTIVVSEENGAISLAQGGLLKRNLDSESLRRELEALRMGKMTGKKNRRSKRRDKEVDRA